MSDYSTIKKWIMDADRIIIGAGAGLSTAAGISYGKEGFAEHFPELVEKYHMTDMYSSSFYPFQTEEEKWSYWAKHINYLYQVEAKGTYLELYKLVKDKDYFVITTNVDGQFLKAGFSKGRVFEVQGTLSKIQCAVGCHNKLYDDLELVSKCLKADKDCRIPSKLVPYCPRCGEKMDVNLRKDEFFVEDDNWHQLNANYQHFIRQSKDKKLLLLELGVGFNTPIIIRFPFEKMTLDFSQAYLIRVNNQYLDFVYPIEDKAIVFNTDCHEWIQKLSS